MLKVNFGGKGVAERLLPLVYWERNPIIKTMARYQGSLEDLYSSVNTLSTIVETLVDADAKDKAALTKAEGQIDELTTKLASALPDDKVAQDLGDLNTRLKDIAGK